MPVRNATHRRVVVALERAEHERDRWQTSAMGAAADAERATDVLATSMQALLALHCLDDDGVHCAHCGQVSPCDTGALLPRDQPDVARAWVSFDARRALN